MSKPWDKLRTSYRPTLRAGEWQLAEDTFVRWHAELNDVGEMGACITTGTGEPKSEWTILLPDENQLFSPTNCRLFGEFLIELADQLGQP